MINIKTLWTNISSKYQHWQYRRRCIKYFGAEPETVYVSKEAYDELIKRINEPPDPEATRKLKALLERKAPWEE
jgi:hypothetical protein